jgi:hypothetical protein
VTGWEVVAAIADAAVAGRLAARAARVRPITPGRYRFELATDAAPEPFIAELAAAGGALVSVNALRTTLEEVFVRAVASSPAAPGALADGSPT